MRTVLVIGLIGLAAGCVPTPPSEPAVPQPPAAAAPIALVAMPAPAAIAPPPPSSPPPPPPPLAGVEPPAPLPAVYLPNPLASLFTAFFPPPPAEPGRVTLSNFDYDAAHVQAVITPFSDCQARSGTALSDFEIPLNGTRIIAAPPGNDVCWRRALPAAPSTTGPAGPQFVAGWTEWNRVFTASGRSIDSRL